MASEFLLGMSWVASLPPAARDRVLAEAYTTVHDAHAVVARRGQAVDSWMGVVNGLLKVVVGFQSGKSVVFTGIPERSWVGECSVLKQEIRHYDIVARRPSCVVHIPLATFHWLLTVSFDFNRFIIDHLNERLAQFMAMVQADRMTDPVSRLCRAIVGLYNPVLYPGRSGVLEMSQEELGELAGLTRQRTNQAIQSLVADGLVQPQYGALLVRDLVGLRHRSSHDA